MSASNIERVWAQALLEAAREKKRLEAVAGQARLLRQLLADVPPLALFLASPKVAAAEKKAVLDKACRKRIDPLVMDFLGLMTDRHRAMLLADILDAFQDLYHEEIGVLVAHVRTAVPLAEAETKRMGGTLEKITGKKIELDARVDPAILGGLVIKVEDTLFDASLKSALKDVGERMRRAHMETEVLYADSNR